MYVFLQDLMLGEGLFGEGLFGDVRGGSFSHSCFIELHVPYLCSFLAQGLSSRCFARLRLVCCWRNGKPTRRRGHRDFPRRLAEADTTCARGRLRIPEERDTAAATGKGGKERVKGWRRRRRSQEVGERH